MLCECGIACLVALLVIYCCKIFIKNVTALPPGPWGLPLLGYYPFLGSQPLVTISKLADKYGDIMSVNYCGIYYYYINSYEAVKEVFIKQTNYTFDRPEQFALNSPFAFAFGTKNLMNISGNKWKEEHHYYFSKLRILGMGKTRMEDIINPLCDKLVDNVRETDGKATDYYNVITNFTSNVISELLYKKNYDIDDPEYISLRDTRRTWFSCVPGIDGNLSGKLFYIIYRLKGDYYKRIVLMRKRIVEYFKPIIAERLKERELNKSGECHDLLDYIIEASKDMNKNEQLEIIAENCFMWLIAGTETTSSTLYHALNLMILHQNIQKRVQEEIDAVCGSERSISYQDRHLLPYTQAVIQEVQRFAAIFPFSAYHGTSKPITVKSNNATFVIPAKSSIIPNIWKISRDPKLFKNPHNFDPNNFLDEKGEFVKNDANMPFSVGKRLCIGSSIASMEFFIALVALLQKFEWKAPKGESVSRVIIEGQGRFLVNFTCCAVLRQ